MPPPIPHEEIAERLYSRLLGPRLLGVGASEALDMILAALREAAHAAACHHGWRGEAAVAISDPCPSCGLKSLFIGSGGGLTCASLRCKSPCVEDTWQKRVDAARQEEREALRDYVVRRRSHDNPGSVLSAYDLLAWLDARSRVEEPK